MGYSKCSLDVEGNRDTWRVVYSKSHSNIRIRGALSYLLILLVVPILLILLELLAMSQFSFKEIHASSNFPSLSITKFSSVIEVV